MKCRTILIFIVLGLHGLGQSHSLSFYVDQARQNSPLLLGYQNQILSNKLDSQILLATLKPQINLLSTDAYAPVINGWGYDNAITNTANVSGIVQVRKDFVSKSYLNTLQKSIRLQNQALLDTIRLSERDLIRAISDQYILAYGDMLAMDYTAEIFSLLKKEEEALKKLAQDNVFKQTDYLAFVVTLQQQELNLMQSRILYNADYLGLAFLAGINDTAITRLDEPVLRDSLVSADIYQAIFFRRFITDSLRIANEKSLIDYNYKPRISAFTDAGYNSSLQYLPYKNFGLSAGIALTIPIYDGRQKQFKYSKLELLEKTRTAERDFFRKQYNQQVAQLVQQLNATESLIEKIDQQIRYTNTLITADLKLLETGDIKLTDLVLAINNYFNARNLLRQNNISKLKILNQIKYWNP